MTGHLCFGALWNFCLSLDCDPWAVEGKLFFWISVSAQFSVKCNIKNFIGRILGPILFTHFLKHLFAPIMGKFDEPNMGLPILGSQYLVNYVVWVV